MFSSELDAIVPMLCVTLAALASMGAEAFRGQNERLPIGGLGIVGLVGAAVSSVLLWNRSATGFGVIQADNFGLFVTLTLVAIGILTILFSAPVLERNRIPSGEYYSLVLFAIVGMLSDRRHTRLISEFGGLRNVMPRLTAAFLIITLASVGMPALNGFVGEFLIMLGAFRWDPRYVVGAGLGVILSAVYMLWMVQRVFYGPVTNEKNASLPDLRPREWAAALPLCAVAIVMGVFPVLFLKPMEPSVRKIVEQVGYSQPVRVEQRDDRQPQDAKEVVLNVQH